MVRLVDERSYACLCKKIRRDREEAHRLYFAETHDESTAKPEATGANDIQDTNPDEQGSPSSGKLAPGVDGFGPGDYSGGYTGRGDSIYWGPAPAPVNQHVNPDASATEPSLE